MFQKYIIDGDKPISPASTYETGDKSIDATKPESGTMWAQYEETPHSPLLVPAESSGPDLAPFPQKPQPVYPAPINTGAQLDSLATKSAPGNSGFPNSLSNPELITDETAPLPSKLPHTKVTVAVGNTVNFSVGTGIGSVLADPFGLGTKISKAITNKVAEGAKAQIGKTYKIVFHPVLKREKVDALIGKSISFLGIIAKVVKTGHDGEKGDSYIVVKVDKAT